MSASAPAIDTRAAAREATQSVKKSGTSFAAGMAILPKPRREAMHAIYAFCREVDDIADDERLSASEKQARLGEWRREIDRLYAGRPALSAGLALLEPVRAYDLPKNEFLMMIEGMEMDADGPIVAPSFDRLFAYTRRVAGAVGLLSMPVFGAPKGEASDRFALALGDALQLTNILRDVAEDARIGRLYLPAELLAKHGAPASAETIGRVLSRHLATREDGDRDERADGSRPALEGVAEELAEIARSKFAAARAALAFLDWRSVRPALLMMGAYEAYLRKMTARGWERVGEPVSLSKAEKLFIAARYGFAPPLKSVHA
jgi:phytoene synthase